LATIYSGSLMGDKEEALFKQRVISVIRKCVLFYSPVVVFILASLGSWLFHLNSNIEANTKGLARVETAVQYIAEDLRGRK